MDWRYDDGGRTASGFKGAGTVGDCGPRAFAIATGRPYRDVYDELQYLQKEFIQECIDKVNSGKRTSHEVRGVARKGTGHSVRNGTYRETVRRFSELNGITYVSTTSGDGHKARFDDLYDQKAIVCNLSKHYAAVIDGVIRDCYDPSREGTRAVYGYWKVR